MIKKAINQGFRSGLIVGAVFVFLIMIGFVFAGSKMIGDLIGNRANHGIQERMPLNNLLIFISSTGIIAGISTGKAGGSNRWMPIILRGLSCGLSAGLSVGALVWGFGSLHFSGVDFRTYLPNLGPEGIKFLLFYSTPLAAAQTYLLYFVIFSLVGVFLTKVLLIFSQQKHHIQKPVGVVRNWFSIKPVQRVISNKAVVIALLVLGVGVLYSLPLLWGSYWNYIMGTVAVYILLGLGLNIIVGYSGQLVLGYVAFFAVGAYTFALLTAPEPHGIGLNLWLAVGLSILTSVLSGLLLGLPILNLRGDYLAIVTLGFGEIVRVLIRSDLLTPLTNGPNGVTDVGQPSWRGEVFSDVNYMHLLMILVLLGLFVAKRIKDSRTGRAWIAIREDQTVAQATGINTYRSKILALLLGAAFAGLSGALFASRNQFTGPEDFTLMVSINVLCIVIVGGMGSLPGVVLGAFVLKGLPELLRELADYRLLVFGALLVLMMIVRPQGLWPVRKKKYHRAYRDKFEENPSEVEA
jgi:ABC-type branched-subunit amino acid transport system permease subunit